MRDGEPIVMIVLHLHCKVHYLIICCWFIMPSLYIYLKDTPCSDISMHAHLSTTHTHKSVHAQIPWERETETDRYWMTTPVSHFWSVDEPTIKLNYSSICTIKPYIDHLPLISSTLVVNVFLMLVFPAVHTLHVQKCKRNKIRKEYK